MRAKEVERLRSENLDYSCIARDLDFDITKKARLIDAQHDGILRLRKRLAAKDARIKELESEITAWIADRDSWIARYEAVREAPREMAELMAREALERIRNGDLCPKHFTERMRERIKEGGKDESQ